MIKIKNIFISILFIFLLCGISFGLDYIIKSDIRIDKDGADDYILTSVPQEIRDSKQFSNLDRIGMINCVLICRENGKWDKEYMIMSRRHKEDPLIVNAIKHLQTFMNLCDETIPNEEIIAICYYADFEELFIYLHPDKWKNKKIHEEVSKKLNDALRSY